MDKLIAAFPQNIIDALAIASGNNFRKPLTEIRNIVICGMGGSGIGGKIVAQWIESEIEVPVVFVQDYELPNFVNQHTLIIGSSYSGNTEETLSCVEAALKQGAHIIGICSGGLLKEFCTANGLDCVVVPGGNPPRSAVAFSIVQLLDIFEKLGFISGQPLRNIRSAYELITEKSAQIKEESKKLAAFLNSRMIVIYSSSNYEGIAIRARQQFNENGKMLCWHHVIPEMNHNELVGWAGGDQHFGAVILDSGDWNPRNLKRLEFSVEVIRSKTEHIYQLKTEGASLIERSVYYIHLVDWASWYLSELRQVDALDIKVIDSLKDTLSSF